MNHTDTFKGKTHLTPIGRIIDLYVGGLRSMKLGKTLWKIIFIKIIIIFFVFKYFFFPDVLQQAFHSDTQRAEHVFQALTSPSQPAFDNIEKPVNSQKTTKRR